jgi:hypothetical protein
LPTKQPHPNPPQACRPDQDQPVATSLSLAPQPGAIKEPKSKIKNQNKIKNQKIKNQNKKQNLLNQNYNDIAQV